MREASREELMERLKDADAENAKVKQAYESAATSNVTLIQKVALLEADVERLKKELAYRDKMGAHIVKSLNASEQRMKELEARLKEWEEAEGSR